MPGTRKLGRPTAHRKAMLRGMVTLLLENGQVETTLTRAKEVRSVAEKMITLGKKNTLASRRAALAYITKEDVVTKVFSELAPLYENRNGGYTQIFKLGPRRGDGAEMAIVKLIDYVKPEEKAKKSAKKEVVKKVFDELAPLYENRAGGYTQIFKLGPRRGDGAEMAIIKLVDYVKPVADDKSKKKEKKEKKVEAEALN